MPLLTPHRNSPREPSTAICKAVLGLSALYIVAYVTIACLRMRYPFELEWMEGGAVDEVRRILAGQRLYVPPSLDFVPFIYTPLYFYVSALVARIVGIGFFPLRLVSFAASLGCFVVIFQMVRRQTASNFAAGLATGLFAACYRAAGAWFDLARVDTLGLFLLLAAIHLLQLNASLAVCLTAAVLMTAAFQTKQMALAMLLPLIAWSVSYHRRLGILLAGAVLALLGGSVMLLSRLSDGWYELYVFALPGKQKLLPGVLTAGGAIDFLWRDIIRVLPIASALAVYFLVVRFRHETRRSFFFWLATAVGTVGGTWASRAHYGGYDNVLMPAYAVVAVLAAMGAHAALERARSVPARAMPWVQFAIYALCVMQLAGLCYDPRRQVPTARDRRAGERLVAAMRRIDGDVLMSQHGYLTVLAGKRAHARPMAIDDFNLARDERTKERLVGELERAVRERRFGAIIEDSIGWPSWLPSDIGTYYSRHSLPLAPNVLWPVTGMRTRPRLLYLPRRTSANVTGKPD
ncbi:MAG: hypothetical protein PHU25_06550 [Deltaproteobacteria bacterium]|nr:hypothetical protein [Deltaproteobacteria bacterium]